MSHSSIRPHLVYADTSGNIFDHPDLLMMCRRGEEWALPRPAELIPLPEESELFLLPSRNAVGLDGETGRAEEIDGLAVAAFVAPGYTLSAHPVYTSQPDAPRLPLFAYGAVGFANDRFYVCARQVDTDPRQVFTGFAPEAICNKARKLIAAYPSNRLMQHLMNNCVLKYACPAARNLAIGRYECPLPVSHVCNARCLGCISLQNRDESGIITSPQDRMTFTPTTDEVLEVMRHHLKKEPHKPIYSFGQGCEGEPLTEAELLIEVVRRFRQEGGIGTVNLNTNASRPDAVIQLAEAGLSSLRASMNSARPEVYQRYYRPKGYSLDDVRTSMREASRRGVHVAINLLYFPGVTDTEEEIEALCEMIGHCQVSLIQMRNLNIDPEWYLSVLDGIPFSPSVGLATFMKRIQKTHAGISFGYFNPWLPERHPGENQLHTTGNK